MSKYQSILNAVSGGAWAIRPEKLSAIMAVLDARVAGERRSVSDMAADLEPAAARAEAGQAWSIGGVAVLPLLGILSQRMDMMLESSGGTSTDRFARDFDAAVADQAVGAIVLDVDSPGGRVFGVGELAHKVHAARGQKPIIAVVNSEMASGAYWIGSQADEVVVTPGGELGSIGVITVHLDASKADEQAGLSWSYISAGKYKTEGNPHDALGDEARGHVQGRIDSYYGMFVAAVAQGRGVKPAEVRRGFGEGRMLGASDAIAQGMADRVGTLDEAIARAGKLQRRGRSAALAARELALAKNRAESA